MRSPGWNSLVLLVLAALAGPLAAQGLPALQQFEVENARLILLDAQGNRRGVLEGELARKRRDGNVEVRGAVLTMTRGDTRLVLRSPLFQYAPASESFECPQGLQAELPDGGALEMPSATGSISMGVTPVLKLNCEGAASFRSADPETALLTGSLNDPVIEAAFSGTSGAISLATLKLDGKRGGEVRVRVASVPSPDGGGTGPGVLSLGCFGDFTISMDATTRRGSISMLRRARMGLESRPAGATRPEGTLEITANQIALRGMMTGSGKADLASSLRDLEIDAAGTVHLTAPRVRGFGDELRYREPGQVRTATLSGNPSIDVEQGTSLEPSSLRLKSRRAIELAAPLSPPDETPQWLELRIQAGAQVWRETGGKVAWRISGSRIDLLSMLLSRPPGPWEDEPRGRRETFAVAGEGYSPLLRVAGAGPLTDDPTAEDQRAAVFGSFARGQFESEMLQAEVLGPDILALLYADQGLADELRFALGLARRPETPRARPGRLSVRATNSARIAVSTSPVGTGTPRPLSVSASGSVDLEHTPLPRFDRDLVTFTGDSAALALMGSRVEQAELSGADCLATMGYDLLVSQGFQVRSSSPDLAGRIRGGGRLVVRDRDSLAYFEAAIDRLPRRGLMDARQNPDAGWMNFTGDVMVRGDGDQRSLDASGVVMQLVRGEFETPRAGPSARKDLPELDDSDVLPLYLVRARRLLVVSSGHSTEPRAVVNLLRLEGEALVRSDADRMQATAVDSIEASGADDQRTAGNPLTVVLLGSPALAMEDAGLFFGDVVRKGTFSYDGAWRLEAGQRLELTFRPLAVGGAGSMRGVRQQLDAVVAGRGPAARLLQHAWMARTQLESLLKEIPAAGTVESEEPRKALADMLAAEQLLRLAAARESGVMLDGMSRQAAASLAARADRRLGGLVEVAASGGVRGRFLARDAASPALHLGVSDVLVTFNGLGEIVDTRAGGPVSVARGDYRITGSRLSQARDGTLLLDDAAIQMPDNTGVAITGVKTVSLRQRGGSSGAGEVRTMVTRVSGQGLKVNVKLTRETAGTPAQR